MNCGSIPDNSDSYFSSPHSKSIQIIDEKSIQDFEYNCMGIVCGYYFEENLEINDKIGGKNNLSNHSRRFKSFGNIIEEQVNEESSNESKGSSENRSRRKSVGSKSNSSGFSKKVSLDFEEKVDDLSQKSLENLNDLP